MAEDPKIKDLASRIEEFMRGEMRMDRLTRYQQDMLTNWIRELRAGKLEEPPRTAETSPPLGLQVLGSNPDWLKDRVGPTGTCHFNENNWCLDHRGGRRSNFCSEIMIEMVARLNRELSDAGGRKVIGLQPGPVLIVIDSITIQDDTLRRTRNPDREIKKYLAAEDGRPPAEEK